MPMATSVFLYPQPAPPLLSPPVSPCCTELPLSYFAAFVDSTLSTVLNAFPVSPRAIELLHTMSTTIADHWLHVRTTTLFLIKFFSYTSSYRQIPVCLPAKLIWTNCFILCTEPMGSNPLHANYFFFLTAKGPWGRGADSYNKSIDWEKRPWHTRPKCSKFMWLLLHKKI